jgi:hypothetical protein
MLVWSAMPLGLKGCLFTLDAEHCQKSVQPRNRFGQPSAHASQRQPAEIAPPA